jgi:tRNA modification GTPase
MLNDTIIAVSSPPTGGGIRAIVRLSGPAAWRLAGEVVDLPAGAAAGYYGKLIMPLLNATGGFAAALLFKGPRSFTGDDVAELHIPNSPAVLRACVDRVLVRGGAEARLAGPGEFSARAFFNGKIDLTEAEGIAATINAHSEAELRAATALREGRLHQEIERYAQMLGDALASVEAGIDFSDEEGVSFVDAAKLGSTLEQLGESIDRHLKSSLRVDRLDAAPTVVFIGKPNVGKSSLINALTGTSRSIVSEAAGTTRDILSATLHTAKGEIRLLDVPGDEIPSDDIRSKMMDARRVALLDADLVIRVVDHTQPVSDLDGWTDVPGDMICVQNKSDLLPEEANEEGYWLPGSGKPWGVVSAKTGHHIETLRDVIVRLCERNESSLSGHRLVLNQRHRVLLHEAKTAILDAAGYTRDEQLLRRYTELLAADLRRALDLLGQITGTISPDEVLGRIFSQFCIGK